MKRGELLSAMSSGIQWDIVIKFVDQKNDAEGKLFDEIMIKYKIFMI